jgi:hypothetical protein
MVSACRSRHNPKRRWIELRRGFAGAADGPPLERKKPFKVSLERLVEPPAHPKIPWLFAFRPARRNSPSEVIVMCQPGSPGAIETIR